MNDHLIKNHKISFVKNIVKNLIVFGVIFYLLKSKTDIIDSFDWGATICILLIIYWEINENQILLEIKQQHQNFIIISYSIFKGKKKLTLNTNDIIKIDSYDDLRIRYRSEVGKNSIILKLTAEPWNNLYNQIKNLKLKEQENNKNRTFANNSYN